MIAIDDLEFLKELADVTGQADELPFDLHRFQALEEKGPNFGSPVNKHKGRFIGHLP